MLSCKCVRSSFFFLLVPSSHILRFSLYLEELYTHSIYKNLYIKYASSYEFSSWGYRAFVLYKNLNVVWEHMCFSWGEIQNSGLEIPENS
jgi:hypothetical protein